MAYGRRNYSSGDFDFDGKDPGPGGFFSELFESGKVMIGWGRNRTKWVKLDQAEIVSFLANAHTMVVTDDPVLKDLLGQVAEHLVTSKPLTLEAISDIARTDPAAGARFAAILMGDAGNDVGKACEIFTSELRAKDAKLARLAS